MSTCGSCNTPASSGGNLPAQPSAYLTDPLTATPDTCSQAVANPCAVSVSSRSYLVDFIPGWLQKVTAAASGKLLIARGSVLHFFKGANPGPLYFDGEEVTVAEQPTLPLAATEQSILERGWNVIARKVKRPKVMPNGTVVEKEFFDIGVQAHREETTGELPVLVIDPTSGMSRLDVAKVTEHNLVKDGIPTGLQRLGYQTERVDGGCGQIDRKKFLALSGAIWQEGEILRNQANGLPAILIPRDGDCDGSNYVLGTQEYVENTDGLSIDDEDRDNFRIPIVVPVYGNADCPSQITGYRTVHTSVPDTIFTDFITEDHYFRSTWDFSVDATGSGEDQEFVVPVDPVPDDARFVFVAAEVAAVTGALELTSGSTAWIKFHAEGDSDSSIAYFPVNAANENTADHNSGSFWVPLDDARKIHYSYAALKGPSPATVTVRFRVVGWKR